MPRRRSSLEITLALVLAAGMLAVSGIALYVILTINYVHADPGAIPSTSAGADAGGNRAAIEKSRQAARTTLVDENVPGLSVAVAENGQVLWAEGFGYADVANHKPVTPDTTFRLGSVSKTLTTAGLLLLHDRGRLDLDAPVQKYVPAYPSKQWTVTPRALMSDVAGVHRIRGDNNDRMPYDGCANLGAAVRMIAEEPLLFEPGTSYRFATYGWILLSAVVEGAAAEPFSTFMSREVFTPLGMTRTALLGTDRDSELASGYHPRIDLRPSLGVEDVSPPDYSCFAGAGAFRSTPSDLVRLGSAMLRPGLFKADTISLLQESTRLRSGASTNFSLGWKVENLALTGTPTRILRHRATMVGGAASLTMIPDRQVVIAVTTNVQHLESVDRFVEQVATAFASAK